MSFHRSKSVFSFDYKLGGISIQRVNQVQDLGILFVPSLNFSPHIDFMTSKSFRVLGFIRRHSVNFSSANCLLALYKALVRSVIEYGSVVGHLILLLTLVELIVFKTVLCALLDIASTSLMNHTITGLLVKHLDSIPFRPGAIILALLLSSV